MFKELIQVNNREKSLISKWAEDLNRHFFFCSKHTSGQQVHEKVHNITSHQVNANQNLNKISPHRIAFNKKKKKKE